jgi:general L-amino acid transport system substrate-binding protein
MNLRWRTFTALLLGLALVVSSCGSDDESLLDTVKSNDSVKCGTRDALPGFAVLGDDGVYRGFDSDFCRVIAAAVLGDAGKAEMVPLETAARFTALQSGEVDVLVRNTTWTATRDGGESATFLTPNFYDGQAMMVRADSSYQSMADMDNTTVCLVEGTTTQLNLDTKFEFEGLTLTEALSFGDTDLVQEAFIADRCDGWTSDSSQLVALRSTYPDSEGGPSALRILPDIFSKEPLAPAVADGDSEWASAVNWAVLATMQAEEWGITSSNVDSFLSDPNPNITRFLGQTSGAEAFDPSLGLPSDFAYQVIKQVGNYGEIWDEHIVPLGIAREGTPNDMWINGGLHYAPPYR